MDMRWAGSNVGASRSVQMASSEETGGLLKDMEASEGGETPQRSVPLVRLLRVLGAVMMVTSVAGLAAVLFRRTATLLAEGHSGSMQLAEAPCVTWKIGDASDQALDPCTPAAVVSHEDEEVLNQSAGLVKPENQEDQLPSLFCFAVAVTYGYEPDLVRAQYKKKQGVFNCDAWSMFSLEAMPLGDGVNTTAIPGSPAEWKAAPGKNYRMSFNTDVFHRAWVSVQEAGEYRSHDWVVKSDPDTMFLADALRQKLGSKQWSWTLRWKSAVYIKNCEQWKSMQGPLEVFTEAAFDKLMSSLPRCTSSLSSADMGEDQFLDACLHDLGVQSVNDFDMLSDAYCNGIPQQCACGQAKPQTLAFHPCKSVSSFFECVADAPAGKH